MKPADDVAEKEMFGEYRTEVPDVLARSVFWSRSIGGSVTLLPAL